MKLRHNSLWVQLSLAFTGMLLLTFLLIGVVSQVLVNPRFAQTAVEDHLRQPGGVNNVLMDYYRQHGSWDGVETLFERADLSLLADALIVFDADRNVVYGDVDTVGIEAALHGGPDANPTADASVDLAAGPETAASPAPDPTLALIPASESGPLDLSQIRGGRQLGMPLIQDGNVIGYVDFAPAGQSFDELRNVALWTISRYLIITILVGGAVGVLMSVRVSRTLSAPLDRLAAAARAIGAGQLDQRVTVGGSQEIVTVAHAFNDMAGALEQAEKLRRDMVADVAHELRTPLSVLQGNLQAILDDVYPLDKAEIARLHEQTQLLGRLVEDLRVLSQADAGQLSLSLQRVDLGALVADQIENFAPMAAEKGIALEVTSSADLPPVEADPSRLSQVLHNLLDNALRHTPSGGTIHVRVSTDAGQLRVAVQDSGEGISAEHLAHVFDRFYRVDTARGRNAGGAGLGLAIARSIVTAHGGTIHVESDPESGPGSTFIVRLPAAPPPPETPIV